MPGAEVRALVPFVMLLFVAALGFEMFRSVRSVSSTMPGSSVSSKMSENSVVVTFSFHPAK